MSKGDSHWLHFEDAKEYQKLHDLLVAAGYTVPGVLEKMGAHGSSITTTDKLLILQHTQEGRPIDTLMRLFLAKSRVSTDALNEAIAPMNIEVWEKAGLIGSEDGSVFARLKILPFDRLHVVQEIYTPGMKQPPDYVVGIGAATLTVANFMIRRRSHLALDLGTGCGILALLKSADSDRVIAADRNPRAIRMTEFNARLNGLSNIDCREGDLFEPVTGLKFDLILSNAPFVISPSSGYLYLDGGMQGDQFCQRLVRGAAQFLSDGGYCQFLCNWAHLKGQDWQERLAGWFKDTGCNVWVLRGATQDRNEYAKEWVQHIYPNDTPEFARTYDEWMSYYARENIEAMSMGLITMQRAAGPNWFRIDGQPETKNRDLGENIIRIFELKNFLNRVDAQDSLLNCTLRAAPDLRLDIRYAASEEGWRPMGRHVRLDTGLGFMAETDELASNFIVRCDGKRTVGSVLSEIASSHGLDLDKMVPGASHVIRHLIERGFLLPAEWPIAAASAKL